MLFSPVQAANDLTSYIGFDGTIDVDVDYGMIRLGIMPTDNTAIEYRLGRGTSDDTVNGVDFELESAYGVYGLYHFNFSENASIYGALGISNVSFKASLGTVSDQDDERGLSYGIGAQLYGFNVEYMQYLDTTDLEVGAVAVGYNYEFE